MMKSIDKNTYLDRERERDRKEREKGGGQWETLRRGRPKTKENRFTILDGQSLFRHNNTLFRTKICIIFT